MNGRASWCKHQGMPDGLQPGVRPAGYVEGIMGDTQGHAWQVAFG